MGLVFQNYALWPHLTVQQNVEFGLKLRMPENEASGVIHYSDQLYVNNSATTPDDFAKLQDWQDF